MKRTKKLQTKSVEEKMSEFLTDRVRNSELERVFGRFG